jgi:CarD family transcriptional regulator
LKKAKSKMSKMKSPTTTEFQVNDHVVYPTHGVGKIIAIETQEIAGMSLELFVIRFDNEKMTLRVPTMKAAQTGMRKLSDDTTVADAMKTLKGKAKIKRTMWSRRAQEYEAKINSGNLVSIAEVVRDLYRGEDQPEQSYSERQLFEAAFERLTRELAAVEKIAQSDAAKQVETALDKNAA